MIVMSAETLISEALTESIFQYCMHTNIETSSFNGVKPIVICSENYRFSSLKFDVYPKYF